MTTLTASDLRPGQIGLTWVGNSPTVTVTYKDGSTRRRSLSALSDTASMLVYQAKSEAQAYRAATANVSKGGHVVRWVAEPTETKPCEYTGWHKPIRVTLTKSDNPYLADQLPMRGWLQVHETLLDGRINPHAVSFAQERGDGSPWVFVAVDNPEFTYGG